MAARTLFLGRLIGLYCLICGLAAAIHKHAVVDGLTAILNDPKMLWSFGLISLIAGLAMVLAHNLWSGGPLPVVVTLAGWGMLLKGGLALFLPAHAMAHLYIDLLRLAQCFYLYAALALLVGLYLTWEGFRPRSA